MSDEVLKKLGFIEAYEFLFGVDGFTVKESVAENAGEYSEWQEFNPNNEKAIEKYKDTFIDSFNKAKIDE